MCVCVSLVITCGIIYCTASDLGQGQAADNDLDGTDGRRYSGDQEQNGIDVVEGEGGVGGTGGEE